MAKNENIVIDLKKARIISKMGINDALFFARLVNSGRYELQSLKELDDSECFKIQIFPNDELVQSTFDLKINRFQEWTLSNCVNEMIEKFYMFLEYSICFIFLNNKKNREDINSQSKLNEKIAYIRYKYNTYEKMKNYLTSKKDERACISETDDKLIKSFNHIRNILTHNAGILDSRMCADSNQETAEINWFILHPSLVAEDGVEYEVNAEGRPDTSLLLRLTKQTKIIEVGRTINFSINELEEIAFTFSIITDRIFQKVCKVAPLD